MASGQVHPTNAPIEESERIATREREKAMRTPFPWLMLVGTVVLVAVAVVAVTSAGPSFAIPIALIAVVIGIFFGAVRIAGGMRERSRDLPRGSANPHADLDRSTGTR